MVSEPRRSGNKRNHAPHSTGIWLYGHHAVSEALRNKGRQKHRLLYTTKTADLVQELLKESPFGAEKAEIADRAEIEAVCGSDSVHQGIALLVSPLPDMAIEDIVERMGDGRNTAVMLDQATDPRNIGAVMRSARAFGASAVIVQDRNAPPETGAMAKAASGALEHVSLVRVTNLARALWTLKDSDFWAIGLDGHASDPLGDISPNRNTVIVMGAEGTGLRRLTRETCDQLVKIPIVEESESLNLSNAAAIALYEISRTGPTFT